MAANYSQYTDHNEVGGLNVGLEDAKLAAADSVDEVVSTDCVLMKDASGNPVKILKEDFNEAVRDALGSILSGNALGTAIGKVAALGSSDNDFGSISTGDLASVLDVTKGTFIVPTGGALKISFSGKYQLIASILGTSTYATSSAMVSGYEKASNRNRCSWIIKPSGNDVLHVAVSDTLKELYIFNGTGMDVTVSITELLHTSTITCTVINDSTTLSGYTYIDPE